MPRIKNDTVPAVPAAAITTAPAVQLSKVDLTAIELAKAYVAFHGKVAPDVMRDTVVESAKELAKQMGWKD